MYGTIEDLEAVLATKFTTSSSPTRAQVTSIMETHSEVLNVMLRARGVPVPGTGTSAYKFLTRIVVLLTGADVLRRQAMEAGNPSSPMADIMERTAFALIEQAKDAPQALIET